MWPSIMPPWAHLLYQPGMPPLMSVSLPHGQLSHLLKSVASHPPFSVPMIQGHLGHLDHQRSNLRSTQEQPPSTHQPASLPTPTLPLLADDLARVRTHNIYVDCQQLTGQIASDLLPGRFLVSSNRRGHSMSSWCMTLTVIISMLSPSAPALALTYSRASTKPALPYSPAVASNPACNAWTMRPRRRSNSFSLSNKPLTINLPCPMCTGKTPPKGPFGHSRIISLPLSVALILNFPSTSGIASFPRHSSP